MRDRAVHDDMFVHPARLDPTLAVAEQPQHPGGEQAAIADGLALEIHAAPDGDTMLVAAFVAHGSDPLADKEHALLYALAFLAVLLLGPGRWSVDTWWAERKV